MVDNPYTILQSKHCQNANQPKKNMASKNVYTSEMSKEQKPDTDRFMVKLK